MSTKQKTIKQEVSINGIGLHTGEKSTVTFKPAEENHGFVFRRVDLDGKPTIKQIAILLLILQEEPL